MSSRSYLEPPSIEVVFPSGFKDEFVLEHYKLFKGSKGGHNYIGYLKSTPDSSVAVTGSLLQPDDRMQITLMSPHTGNQLFEVDYFRKTTLVPIPEEIFGKKNLTALDRQEKKDQDNQLTVVEGDEIVDEEVQQAVYSTGVVPLPSKIKMVIKLGYTESLAQELAKQNKIIDGTIIKWPEYIEKVMVHLQAVFYDPSFGTKVKLEAQDGFLYSSSTTWVGTSVSKARDETRKFKLQDVDATVWITHRSGSYTVGTGYKTVLCTSHAVSINENLVGSGTTYQIEALLVAHEMGHNMALSHDSHPGEDNNPCGNLRGIMATPLGNMGWNYCNAYNFKHAFAAEFWGHGCLEDISRPCTEFTCENGGTCSETENGGFTCSCPSGITGERCEKGGCNGASGCCSSTNKCREWEGDCNSDSDCLDGLRCGTDNCPRKYGHEWDLRDDCCFKIKLVTETTCLAKTPQVSCDKGGARKAATCSDCLQGNGITTNF